jgi:alanyl-tRNA synthetase
MQFNRDANGKLNPLPKPSVDTGMGLERVTAALEGKISNFDTDLFMPLIREAEKFVPFLYGADPERDPSFRIVADHARATTFLVADGVIPSNEGRGYVLRKIMRRGMRHARLLEPPKPFFTDMVVKVRELMTEPYPELEGEAGAHILKVVAEEERRFSRTIEVGLAKLDDLIEARPLVTSNQEWPRQEIRVGAGTLRGADAFKLYDTYGLPRDFIEDVTRDAGVEVDWLGFEQALEEQRKRAKASWKGTSKDVANPAYARLAETFKTEPDFYFGTDARDCRIESIVTKGGLVNEIKAGTEAEVVLDRTSIYAESGGQVADIGGFYDSSKTLEVAEVKGAYYPVTGLVAHRIIAKEDLHIGDRLATLANPERRKHNTRNHTATHLMNAALRNILGSHVKQSGSLVASDHLRFDFSHFAAVDPGEIADVEVQVNEEIRRNGEVRTDIMNIDDALASGALAFFGDKYPEANVRVVTIADAAYPRGFYSRELCGGTHVARAGDIGIFKVVGEQSVAAGVRRVEAITSDTALADYQRALKIIHGAAGLLNSTEEGLLEALERQIESAKQLEKQLETLKRKAAGSQAQSLLDEVRDVKGVKVLAAQVANADRESLRQMIDSLRQKLGSGVVVLGTPDDGKVTIIAGVTKDLIPRLDAGKIVQELAKQVGGSGGGRPDLAEAGGKDTAALESTLRSIYPLLDRWL